MRSDKIPSSLFEQAKFNSVYGAGGHVVISITSYHKDLKWWKRYYIADSLFIAIKARYTLNKNHYN